MENSNTYFLDTNIPIYAAGRKHLYKSPCVRIILAVGESELDAITDAEVIQEIAHQSHALRRPDPNSIAEEFLRLMQDNVLPVTENDMARCLALLKQYPFLRPRDAVHVAVMLNAGIERIITADRHFDQVKEITRLDPLTFSW
jgi:uncharacterized protein